MEAVDYVSEHVTTELNSKEGRVYEDITGALLHGFTREKRSLPQAPSEYHQVSGSLDSFLRNTSSFVTHSTTNMQLMNWMLHEVEP